VVLCQRRHHLRVADDERRINTLRLNVLADKRIQHASICEWRCKFNLELLQEFPQKVVGFLRVELVVCRPLVVSELVELFLIER